LTVLLDRSVLIALARSNEVKLATFDHGLFSLHPDVAELVAVE